MLELKLTNKYTIKDFPSELDEITMQQCVDMHLANDETALLRAVIGDKVEELPADMAKNTYERLLSLCVSLKVAVQEWLSNPQPAPMVIGETTVKLDSINTLPYTPTARAQDTIRRMGDEPYNKLELYPDLVAHYTYTSVTGKKYDEYDCEESFIQLIMLSNFRAVILLGDFFLHRQHKVWQTRAAYLKTKLSLKLKKLA